MIKKVLIFISVTFSQLLFSNEIINIKMCALDTGFGKYTTPNKDGVWQLRVFEYTKNLPVQIDFHFLPRKRCLYEASKNNTDAVFAAINLDRVNYLEFPRLKNNELDTRSAVGKVTYSFYKHKTSPLEWDGKQFINLNKRSVGVQRGLDINETLHLTGIDNADIIQTIDQIISMLNSERISGAIIEESQAEEYIKNHHADSIIKASKPYHETYVYMAFSKKFYAKNSKIAEAIWDNFKKLKSK